MVLIFFLINQPLTYAISIPRLRDGATRSGWTDSYTLILEISLHDCDNSSCSLLPKPIYSTVVFSA